MSERVGEQELFLWEYVIINLYSQKALISQIDEYDWYQKQTTLISTTLSLSFSHLIK